MNDIVKFDIIMLALPRWDGEYSSTSYSLAKALSKHTRVFYIDNPYTFKDYISKRNSPEIIRRKQALTRGKNIFTVPDSDFQNLVAVTPRLIIPINWLNSGEIYNWLSKWNDQVVSESINKTIAEFRIDRYIFINSFNPLFGHYLRLNTKPWLNIYHSIDDISKSTYVARHGTRLENEAVKKADFTIVTSMELKRLKSEYSDKVFYLPNAADVRLFNKAVTEELSRPKELSDVVVSTRTICYTGNICHRLDYELLLKIASRFPNDNLLMVGPFGNDNYKKAGLDKLSNVIFAGKKSIDELPAYLRYTDCCIIPFLLNDLTKSIYPLKINEYLSAGKPVVTTNFSEDIANFADIARVSNSHDEFLNNIEDSFSTNGSDDIKKRMEYAAGNSWDARANQFLELIRQFTS